MTQNPIDTLQRRGRTRFILLAALFAAPFILAWLYIAVFGGWRPGTTVNHGTLVQPARPLNLPALSRLVSERADTRLFGEADWRQGWTLVQIADGACSAECRATLHTTRQVRLALGKEASRVQRVLINTGEMAEPEYYATQHPLLILLSLPPNDRTLVLSRFTVNGEAPAGRLFLVDPLGNLMMWYPLDIAPDALNDDLKRLLKYSQIG